ncbi:MAG TPA: alpha-glucuronidase family glycosyl hydrolase, partial [Terriglobales bacterium]|nr:alpha-glucuronidase family glycosyl hydrolase [Terriglobales bacterium]
MQAETGEEAWLRYAQLSAQETKQYQSLPSSLVVLGDSPLLKSAQQELMRGFNRMLGKQLAVGNSVVSAPSAIVIGTADAIRSAAPNLQLPDLQGDGYWLATRKAGDQNRIFIAGADERAVLY